MSSTEYKRLRLEAEQLYRQYGKLKGQFRVDRSNVALNNSILAIETRYIQLEHSLNSFEENTTEAVVDLNRLEPTPFRVHKPVHVEKEYSPLDGFLSKMKPRTLISLALLLVCGSILFFISTQSLGFYRVPTSSMTPTLIPNDQLITFVQNEYHRGEIIVLHDPFEKDAFLVKRLVAAEGDNVYIHDGVLFIDSKPINEPYIKEAMNYEFGPYRVKPGEILILGDNRNASEDSHRWQHGVPVESIVGAVRHIYRPLERFSRVHSHREAFASVQ